MEEPPVDKAEPEGEGEGEEPEGPADNVGNEAVEEEDKFGEDLEQAAEDRETMAPQEREEEEAQEPLRRQPAGKPTPDEIKSHRVSHLPFRNWCRLYFYNLSICFPFPVCPANFEFRSFTSSRLQIDEFSAPDTYSNPRITKISKNVDSANNSREWRPSGRTLKEVDLGLQNFPGPLAFRI